MSGIGSTSAHGIFWTMLRVLGQTGISFGVGILLARLLDVADFGLMAIAYIFIGLAELLASLGVEGALIQRKELAPQHIAVALSLSLVMALALLVLFWLTSFAAACFASIRPKANSSAALRRNWPNCCAFTGMAGG